jgi:hypothetical protein
MLLVDCLLVYVWSVRMIRGHSADSLANSVMANRVYHDDGFVDKTSSSTEWLNIVFPSLNGVPEVDIGSSVVVKEQGGCKVPTEPRMYVDDYRETVDVSNRLRLVFQVASSGIYSLILFQKLVDICCTYSHSRVWHFAQPSSCRLAVSGFAEPDHRLAMGVHGLIPRPLMNLVVLRLALVV